MNAESLPNAVNQTTCVIFSLQEAVSAKGTTAVEAIALLALIKRAGELMRDIEALSVAAAQDRNTPT